MHQDIHPSHLGGGVVGSVQSVDALLPQHSGIIPVKGEGGAVVGIGI